MPSDLGLSPPSRKPEKPGLAWVRPAVIPQDAPWCKQDARSLADLALVAVWVLCVGLTGVGQARGLVRWRVIVTASPGGGGSAHSRWEASSRRSRQWVSGRCGAAQGRAILDSRLRQRPRDASLCVISYTHRCARRQCSVPQVARQRSATWQDAHQSRYVHQTAF